MRVKPLNVKYNHTPAFLCNYKTIYYTCTLHDVLCTCYLTDRTDLATKCAIWVIAPTAFFAWNPISKKIVLFLSFKYRAIHSTYLSKNHEANHIQRVAKILLQNLSYTHSFADGKRYTHFSYYSENNRPKSLNLNNSAADLMKFLYFLQIINL